MYILDVIPLALIPRSQDQLLSYYHTDALPVGAVVEVTLNRRKARVVVVGSATIRQRKLVYKKGVDFELKNITRVVSTEPQVNKRQLEIAKYLSDYYYAPLGICLKTILPPFFGKKGYCLKIQDTKYKLQNSRFILIPEKILADHYVQKYQADAFISGATPVKEYFAIWQKVASGEIATLVGTRVGLFLPFANLQEIIVEDEPNPAYKSDLSPRYHGADLAGFIAQLYGAKISYHAIVPRLEMWHEHQAPIANHKINALVVDTAKEIRAGNFSIFSRDLKDELYKIQDTKYKILLYIPRRGHANFLLCAHCEQIVKCPHCSASLVLHRALEEKLICHHCGYKQNWPKSCLACGAHNFKSYGVGIEKVIAELEKFFKLLNFETPQVLRLDSDSVADETTEKKIVADFSAPGPAILVATQMLFSQQPLLHADICGIISADTLINIPDFRAEEALFRQIYTLGVTADQLIIQTRNPDDTAIKLAAAGKMQEFLASELANRRAFNYPPFSQLVKLTYRHRDARRAERETVLLTEKIRQGLKIENLKFKIDLLGPSPAFISQERGRYVWNIILKVPPHEIKKRNQWLRLVPNGWAIDADPRNII